MGLFNKSSKSFKSNNLLFQIISGSPREIEEKLEEVSLYRNIESIQNYASASILIKYKDLKVRSPLEVENIKKQLLKEAGLEFER